MFSKRTSVAATPASEQPQADASAPDRNSTASTTTTSRSSIFSTFSAISAISTFSSKANANKSPTTPEAQQHEEDELFNPVDITPPIAPGPTVTDASVFFPRNPNSKHLAHLTALNTTNASSATASATPSATPSAVQSTAASTSTSPAPSIRASVQSQTTANPTNRPSLHLPPLTVPALTSPTTPIASSAQCPLSPTPSTMSHFSFSYAPSLHGSVIGINNLPNIPQATVTRLVQMFFTIQALKVVGYQAAAAGRCAGVVHRVPFAFGGAVGGDGDEEEEWEGVGGGDLFAESGIDLVLSRLDQAEAKPDPEAKAGERVEEVLARRFPQWFYLQEQEEPVAADNASILSGEGVTGHRRTRSHPGEIAIPDSATIASTSRTTRSRSGTTNTITPPQLQKQLFFHDPSNLLNASFAALSFGSSATAPGATNPPIDFSSVISFAIDHPPPPVSPTGETATSSAAASEAGDVAPPAVTLRTPLAIHIHQIANKGHPYTWLPHLSQTTLATPHPSIGVELGGQPFPIPVPTLPLPTLLITSLLTAHGLLRSLSMGDRKIGNIALRQAVNLASFIRMRGGIGTSAEGGGVVSLPGGVPKDALAVLARLRGEKGNEERRVILWALRSGVMATDPPRTPGGTPAPIIPGKHQHPGGLKRTYTAGANSHLRELVLVNRREGEGWRRSAPAGLMDYRPNGGGATPSIRSFSGMSVTSMGAGGRNSMGYVEEEHIGEDGEVRASEPVYQKRASVDSQAGEMAELRREMMSDGHSIHGASGEKDLLSPVDVPKRGGSFRWSLKGWGGQK